MIEELTPEVLSSSLLLIILTSSVLTLVASALILWLYRRSVLRAMTAAAGGSEGASTGASLPSEALLEQAASHDAPSRAQMQTADSGARQYHNLLRASRLAEMRCAAAGLAFALVMALAALLAFPGTLTLPKLALWTWGYSWPLVLALSPLAPGGIRTLTICAAVFFTPFALGTVIAALTPEMPSQLFGGESAEFRSAITPPIVLRTWLVGNVAPTLLLFLFLNRRIRAVGLLVLGFMTTVTTGFVVTYLALFTRTGSNLVVSTAETSGFSVAWLLLGATVVAVAAFAIVGWFLLRWIRRAYLRRTLNDRSLALDSLWLLFASCYVIWLALAGLPWAASGLMAFAAYKVVWVASRAFVPAPNRRTDARGLTFLRVFSLGRRSDVLFDALARHWRHIGSMQLITGPDVAHSTVQPHQLLDFLAGRLTTHFIGDATSFKQHIEQRDKTSDSDGWYRVNNFFCHANTWEAVLARLVLDGDVILMDLRNFSSHNAGCVHELRHLVNFVPLARCVLLVDTTTDLTFTRRTLHDAWRDLQPESPNRSASPESVNLHQFASGSRALRQLLRRLCDAA